MGLRCNLIQQSLQGIPVPDFLGSPDDTLPKVLRLLRCYEMAVGLLIYRLPPLPPTSPTLDESISEGDDFLISGAFYPFRNCFWKLELVFSCSGDPQDHRGRLLSTQGWIFIDFWLDSGHSLGCLFEHLAHFSKA